MLPIHFYSIRRTLTNLMDIQSNYPRQDIALWLATELNRLAKLTKLDTILAGLYALGVLTFDISSRTLVKDTPSSLIIPMARINGALFIAIVVVTIWWIYRASPVVWKIRNHVSPHSASTTALFCLVSPVLLFIPMSHILDFLVVRSKSADASTMKWYSIKSRSLLVTVFMYLGILSMALSLSTQYVFASPSPMRPTVSLIGGLFNVAMILIGNRIFVKITQNLSKHVPIA